MGVKTRNLGNSEGKDIQWQAPLNADGSTIFNLEAGKGYFINTTGGEVELKLPTGSIGDRIAIMDFGGTFNTNCIRLNLNGQKLNGSTNPSGASGAQNYVKIETQNARLELVFSDSDKGWVVFENEAKTSPTGSPFTSFTEATGGTVTTSGDYKIHTFTGDGNFVVSSVGNSCGGKVSYLVVAGGGGAGRDRGGGAGAGGFREGKVSSDPYTDSPLDAGDGLTVTATTFPITVGGGGAGGPTASPPGVSGRGATGSNSIFSTITSAGGGSSGPGDSPGPARVGGAGGSGGGGGAGNCGGGTAGAGNTPPVSPPQGQNGNSSGGAGTESNRVGGGGGGATQAGTLGVPGGVGCGGDGATTHITGSPVVYAGGGGGGRPTGTAGTGGSGGGGDGSNSGSTGTAGTANTGGGGGGGGTNSSCGGAGGKGIVVIRYKVQ